MYSTDKLNVQQSIKLNGTIKRNIRCNKYGFHKYVNSEKIVHRITNNPNLDKRRLCRVVSPLFPRHYVANSNILMTSTTKKKAGLSSSC